MQTESIDVGQFVVAGQSVGRLYATDAVEVVVPLSDANAVLIPGLWELKAGDGNRRVVARVIAEYGDGSYAWEGYVDRAEASLDEQTRTINVIVRVPNPFTSGTRVEAKQARILARPFSWANSQKCELRASFQTSTSSCGDQHSDRATRSGQCAMTRD